MQGKSDNLLLTPGPLTTTDTVKSAMLHDLGSRDSDFTSLLKTTTQQLMQVAGIDPTHYTTIYLQGSGTFAIEAVITSTSDKNSRWLVIINGRYGERIEKILSYHAASAHSLSFADTDAPCLTTIENVLQEDKSITHVITVHCETTTGIINDIKAIGELAKKYDKQYVVDAMSSFGAVPIDFTACHIDYLISSSNKCLQGLPGFAFVIAKISQLANLKGMASTFSLDLYDQWQAFETHGQFRCTPPIQVFLAFEQALTELIAEGGIPARAKRYQACQQRLVAGMQRLGFTTLLTPDKQGYISTAFHYLPTPYFNFQCFYNALKRRGFLIYLGQMTQQPSFRVGTIGNITPHDIDNFLLAAHDVLMELLCLTSR